VQELKVVTYGSGEAKRVGSVVDGRVFDLNYCAAAWLAAERGQKDAQVLANTTVPSDWGGFLRGGAATLDAARDAVAWATAKGAPKEHAGQPLSVARTETRLGAPILESSLLICMGEMYKSHVDLAGREYIPYPVFFSKMTRLAVGPDDWVEIPTFHKDPVVYGTELTLIIGKAGHMIPADSAMEHVWGYTVFNDMTLRNTLSGGGGKEFDTSGPLGPWVIPADQVANPQNLRLSFRINGENIAMQEGNTSSMRFTIAECIEEVSKWHTLQTGDVLTTGDVGAKEPALKPGDVMEAEIEQIGVLRNPSRWKPLD
jgi:2-keto-4-pentenoate hydratase/2-oxohepta-3-ene-1,7-dioic acid hydratase in catechol pathway